MMKRTGLFGAFLLALLAACSRTPPPDKTSVADAEAEAPPPSAGSPQDSPPPAMAPAQKAAGLLTLIDTAPQCQTFRTQLEAAGKSANSTGADLNAIVVKAGEAGCTRKPGTP